LVQSISLIAMQITWSQNCSSVQKMQLGKEASAGAKERRSTLNFKQFQPHGTEIKSKSHA